MTAERYGVGIALVVATLLIASSHTVTAQLSSRPYDADAVRENALRILQLVERPELQQHVEEEFAGPLQFIVESLQSVSDLSVVPESVLEAIVAMAGSGRMAGDTLLRFDDRAVAPLVRLARTPSKQLYGRNGPVRTLEAMLERSEAQKSLSTRSKTTVRTLASDLIADRTLQSWEIGSAARLAIATGDPELRAAVVRLIDPSELAARGVRPEDQPRIVSQIRQALEKSPTR